MAAEPAEATSLQFDLEDFTLGELADIEDVTGLSVVGTDMARPPMKLMVGFVWIQRRRADPAYTYEQARATPLSALADSAPKAEAASEPPEPEPLAMLHPDARRPNRSVAR